MAKLVGVKKPAGRVCADCGGDLSEFREGADVRHCSGISHAFGARKWGEPHHCIELHPRCWLCHRSLGCRLCSGLEQELLCENHAEHGDRGSVWATKRAFLDHGPIVLQRGRMVRGQWQDYRRQGLEDYPPEWAMEYEPLEVPTNARGFLSGLITNLVERPR